MQALHGYGAAQTPLQALILQLADLFISGDAQQFVFVPLVVQLDGTELVGSHFEVHVIVLLVD